MATQSNGWNEWKNHVLIELEKAHDERKILVENVQKLQNAVTALQVKMAMIGAIAGAATSLIVKFIVK